MQSRDHAGPALRAVAPDDAAALRALFQEQRARMAVVQGNRLWHWFGGVPQGFGATAAALRGVWLQLALVGALGLAAVVAGFTRGPVLWATLATVPLLLLAREWAYGRHDRKTRALYRRAVLRPAVIVARVRDPEVSDLEVWNVFALVDTGAPEPETFRELLRAGERWRAMIDGVAECPPQLAATVALIRAGLPPAGYDGSRQELPDGASGRSAGIELARFFVPPLLLPGERLTSRLVFVLMAPADHSAGHTRVVQEMLWGKGAESLCAALPWQVVS